MYKKQFWHLKFKKLGYKNDIKNADFWHFKSISMKLIPDDSNPLTQLVILFVCLLIVSYHFL